VERQIITATNVTQRKKKEVGLWVTKILAKKITRTREVYVSGTGQELILL
jgi:hypothetical protein